MKILAGITTYNRSEYLVHAARSLQQTREFESFDISIFDDSSDLLSVDDIQKVFPTAEIIRHNRNLGSDANMHYMFTYFLEKKYDTLVIFDADLVVRTDWITVVKNYLDKTDGILSLYNSNNHEIESELAIGSEKFLVKKSIGAAGTVLSREIVDDIIHNVPKAVSYDILWSKYLYNSGKRLICTDKSYFQHIGFKGDHHALFGFIDIGNNFLPDTLETANSVAWVYQDYCDQLKLEFDTEVNKIKMTWSFRIGYMILVPIRFVLYPVKLIRKKLRI